MGVGIGSGNWQWELVVGIGGRTCFKNMGAVSGSLAGQLPTEIFRLSMKYIKLKLRSHLRFRKFELKLSFQSDQFSEC